MHIGIGVAEPLVSFGFLFITAFTKNEYTRQTRK